VWSRDDLGPGAEIEGPAVIEQLDATTVLPPGARGLVDEHGSLLINLGAVSSDRKSP
jgi:N-methylhydantoinase A